MRRILMFIAMLALLGLPIGCARELSDARTPEEMVTAGRALHSQIVGAINRADVDAVMASYWNSADTAFYAPDALQLRGWEAIREGLAQSFASTPGAHLELTEANYQVAGEFVIGYGRWRLTVPSQTGQSTEVLGRFMDVAAERDGKWVYILDHSSAPLAPALPRRAGGD